MIGKIFQWIRTWASLKVCKVSPKLGKCQGLLSNLQNPL
jgi:hypothetical protein